jgi:hypothetical protein
LASSETKIFFRLSSDETAMRAESIIGVTRRVVSSESAGQSQSNSAQSLQVGPQKNSSAGESNQVADREEEQPFVSKGKLQDLDAGECIVLRGQRVWNLRVPSLELSPEIKKAIGLIEINHVKQYKKPNHRGEISKNFDPMASVDVYLKQSQERRMVKKKGKNDDGAGNPAIVVRAPILSTPSPQLYLHEDDDISSVGVLSDTDDLDDLDYMEDAAGHPGQIEHTPHHTEQDDPLANGAI